MLVPNFYYNAYQSAYASLCLHICHEKALGLGVFYNENLTDSI